MRLACVQSHKCRGRMAGLEHGAETSAGDARLVADACIKAAAELGISKDELGVIVGRHRTSL